MKHDVITDDTFLLFAARNYDNPHCHDADEFYEDLKRIKYIKKLITRYQENKELKERLILNHIIVLNNVFGPVNTCRILYFKMQDQMKFIKPFLVLLNILPELLSAPNGKLVHTDEIPMDKHIVDVLRKL